MNILKTKLIKTDKYNETQSTYSMKHFPVSTREWNNSIYIYNKKALNLIPIASTTAARIIKDYFSLFNLYIEKRLRTRKLSFRRRNLSKNRIFLGSSEFKHTNDKVIINLYIFNRQEKSYSIILKKRYNLWKKKQKKYRLKNYEKHKINYWNKYKRHFYKNYFSKIDYLSNMFDLLSKEYEIKKYSIIKYKYLPNSYKNLLIKLDLSFIKFKQKIRRKILEKLHLYFYYRQLIYINKSKFNYNYLQQLKKYLQTIYNKDIEFNLINLKRFYLNSDILSESIKLKLTKNRRRIFKHLTKLRNKVKVKEKHSFRPINLIQWDIIKDIKYKNVTGFRLEAKGRLTKRHTASRSVTKVKYKGNLLNMDSSHKGLSTILLKGNLESNLQYTKLKSKTRIGSFGIKGWVSGN